MEQTIREIMTRDPVILNQDATVEDAAQAMRDRDIGCVLIADKNQKLCGIVTDRDLVIRGIAGGKDPTKTSIEEVSSQALTQLKPSDTIDDAIKLMAKKGIRRIPVIEGGRPVGVLSLGDLALARDRQSALGGISAASPNQ
jgi:CBS domain-containing protein